MKYRLEKRKMSTLTGKAYYWGTKDWDGAANLTKLFKYHWSRRGSFWPSKALLT